MEKDKKLGIWMNHSIANTMEYSDQMVTKSIESKFTHQEKTDSLQKSESLMHNNERHLQSEYYKQIGGVIANYNQVILFGPTDAKVELYNVLHSDHRFDKIHIEIITTDKMTENQQHAFVKAHFTKLNTL